MKYSMLYIIHITDAASRDHIGLYTVLVSHVCKSYLNTPAAMIPMGFDDT